MIFLYTNKKMIKLVISSVIVVILVINSCNAIPLENRIVNGSVAGQYQFPWHALVFVNRPSEPIRYTGGSLISQNFVLTVATFINGAESAQIQMGSTNFSAPLISMESTKFFIHPNYKSGISYDYDIGLIQLPQNVQYSNAHRPIRLISRIETEQLYSGTPATVSGFGVTSDDSVYLSGVLRFASLNIYSNQTLKCTPLSAKAAIPSYFCAFGDLSNASGAACYGDTGGALVVNQGNTWTQFGIASYYPSGCKKDKPTIYTTLGLALDWISVVTGVAVRP